MIASSLTMLHRFPVVVRQCLASSSASPLLRSIPRVASIPIRWKSFSIHGVNQWLNPSNNKFRVLCTFFLRRIRLQDVAKAVPKSWNVLFSDRDWLVLYHRNATRGVAHAGQVSSFAQL